MNTQNNSNKRKAARAANTTANASNKAAMQSMSQRIDALLKRIPKGTFRTGGAIVGGALGGPAGRAAGSALGSGIAAITGYGDYTVSSGINTSKMADPGVPSFTRNSNGISVSHREYVGQIALPNTAAFDATHYVINPGNAELFPWLSNLAVNFQEYKFRGLVFTFQSRTSEYAADNAMGTVMMATNYNVQEKPFTNATNLLNTQFAVSAKPSTSFIHAIECDAALGSNTFRYVRDPAAVDTNVVSDPRFYDLGRTTVATEGIPGAPGYVVGVLYVSYDIDLMTPVLNPPPSVPGLETYTTSLVVSNSTGGEYDNETDLPNSGWQRVFWECVNFAPESNTTYWTVPNIPAQETTAFYSATLENSTQWRTEGTGVTAKPVLDIKRNGAYYIRIRVSYGTTAGNNKSLPSFTAAQVPATLTPSGAAAVSSDVLDASLPHAFGKTTDTLAVADLMYTFNVSGITTEADFVTFTPGRYVASGDLPTTVATNVTMAWTSTALGSAAKIVAP